MPGKNIHEYTIPNNADANDWNNLCLEDIGLYWDLPNFDEAKYYYFHCVDIRGENASRAGTTPVMADSIDEVIDEYYQWRWTEKPHYQLFVPFAALSAASLLVAGMAM